MRLWCLESKTGRPYVLREIQKLPADDQERIVARIETFSINGYEPDRKDMKKLKSYDELYELKIRSNNVNYRIFFTVLQDEIYLIHMADKKAAKIRRDYETAQARIYSLRKDKEA